VVVLQFFIEAVLEVHNFFETMQKRLHFVDNNIEYQLQETSLYNLRFFKRKYQLPTYFDSLNNTFYMYLNYQTNKMFLLYQKKRFILN